jgi:hypothetical protein
MPELGTSPVTAGSREPEREDWDEAHRDDELRMGRARAPGVRGPGGFEADSIDSGYPAVGISATPRQNIQPTEFVIERVKPITRISLRFGMQRFLQLPEHRTPSIAQESGSAH